MYICDVWLSPELSKNPKLLPKMLTHPVIVLTASCLRSWRHTPFRQFWTHVLRADWPSPRYGLEFLNLCSGVSLLTAQRPSSFFSGLTGFRGHSSWCGLRAKMDKGILQDTLTPVKNAEDKIPSLAPIRKHTQKPIHIHPYIYIYIYIYINAYYCATFNLDLVKEN